MPGPGRRRGNWKQKSVALADPSPLNPHLPVRSRQPGLLRPRRPSGRPVHRVVYHGAHFIEPPGRPGQAIFPARLPRLRLATTESEFQLLIVCHNCLSICEPILAGGVGQKRSEVKDFLEIAVIEDCATSGTILGKAVAPLISSAASRFRPRTDLRGENFNLRRGPCVRKQSSPRMLEVPFGVRWCRWMSVRGRWQPLGRLRWQSAATTRRCHCGPDRLPKPPEQVPRAEWHVPSRRMPKVSPGAFR